MKRTSWLLLIPALLFSMLSGYQSQAQTRHGWSPQAKDAAIGGAAGILGGALINGRNRKVGGLIGGLAGAGAGYAIGKHTDNKRKKAAALAAERAAADQRLAAANARAANAEHTAAVERAAEHRSVASSPGTIARVAGATTLAAAGAGAAQGFAADAPSTVVAAGYLPNTQYGVAGTPYPASEVLRKSW